MDTRTLAALLAIALAGCAYTKAGASPEQAAKDEYECDEKAESATGTMVGSARVARRDEVKFTCMRGKGYW